MNKQRMTDEVDVYQQAQARARQFKQQNQQIKSVMERQRQRDVAAAEGQTIPFSSADIIRM